MSQNSKTEAAGSGKLRYAIHRYMCFGNHLHFAKLSRWEATNILFVRNSPFSENQGLPRIIILKESNKVSVWLFFIDELFFVNPELLSICANGIFMAHLYLGGHMSSECRFNSWKHALRLMTQTKHSKSSSLKADPPMLMSLPKVT